jgi:hypothetical protein
LILRVYSVSDKNNYLNNGYKDIPMNRAQSEQDVFLSQPTNGPTYQASIGIYFSDYVLDVIADSNLTQLPQEEPSITQVKPDSRPFLTSTNKEDKTSGYNNRSGQGIK